MLTYPGESDGQRPAEVREGSYDVFMPVDVPTKLSLRVVLENLDTIGRTCPAVEPQSIVPRSSFAHQHVPLGILEPVEPHEGPGASTVTSRERVTGAVCDDTEGRLRRAVLEDDPLVSLDAGDGRKVGRFVAHERPEQVRVGGTKSALVSQE